jgi:hypothetical protein
MNKLPVISGKECIAALEKVGFCSKEYISWPELKQRSNLLQPRILKPILRSPEEHGVHITPHTQITFIILKTNDNAMSTASLLVEINPKVKDRLDHLKLHPAESYSDVIDRLASLALDEEPLNPEF